MEKFAGPAIALEDLSIDRGHRRVIAGLDLELEIGETLLVLGANGAGKSTLLGAIGGQLHVAEGQIRILGLPLESLDSRERARHVAAVPQIEGRDVPWSLDEVVASGRYAWLHPFQALGRDDLRAVAEAIDACGLDDLAGRRFDELSGGERQRGLIAAALAQQARILLLDEPMTFLDLPHRLQLARLLRNLAGEQVTLVLASHRLELLELVDKVLALRDGQATFLGSPEQFVDSSAPEDLFGVSFLRVAREGHDLAMLVPR